MSTVAIDHQRMSVRVSGWKFLRSVIVEPERVLMEIARTANNCHHCPTCQRRVATVQQTLESTDIVWKWEFLEEGGMWLALARKDEQDVIDLLKAGTGLWMQGC